MRFPIIKALTASEVLFYILLDSLCTLSQTLFFNFFRQDHANIYSHRIPSEVKSPSKMFCLINRLILTWYQIDTIQLEFWTQVKVFLNDGLIKNKDTHLPSGPKHAHKNSYHDIQYSKKLVIMSPPSRPLSAKSVQQ